MKSANLVAVALAVGVAALDINFPANFPDCGKTCIGDMLNLGEPRITDCKAEDLKCLCPHADFSRGLRDCTLTRCGNEGLSPVVNKAAEICLNEAGVSITAPGAGTTPAADDDKNKDGDAGQKGEGDGGKDGKAEGENGGKGDGGDQSDKNSATTDGPDAQFTTSVATTVIDGLTTTISTAVPVETADDGDDPDSDSDDGGDGDDSGDNDASPGSDEDGESLGTMVAAAPALVVAAFVAAVLP